MAKKLLIGITMGSSILLKVEAVIRWKIQAVFLKSLRCENIASYYLYAKVSPYKGENNKNQEVLYN